MTHLLILRYVLASFVMGSPFLYIYLQQSVFRMSFDDDLGNRLILRLHIISTVASVCLFMATFDWGRELLQ